MTRVFSEATLSDPHPPPSGPEPDWSKVLGVEPASTRAPAQVSASELAAQLAGRLCHDFISPASAIMSGLELLDDPSAADMRADAMNLIAASAKKLVAIVAFSRVAFGASTTAENFGANDLSRLAEGVFAHMRAELDWAVEAEVFNKPSARALLNVCQIGGDALPSGGVARVEARMVGGDMLMSVESTSPRARLRAETQTGLRGEPLDEGLGGFWVQAYYLHTLLAAAGGQLDFTAEEGRVVLRVRCPA